MGTFLGNRKILWIAFGLYVGCVMFLCFYKFGELFEIEFELFGQWQDKFFHFVMFFPFVPFLSLLISAYYRDSLSRNGIVWSAVLVAVVFAFFTEMVQYYLPYRSFQWGDLLVDTLSALMSVGVGYVLLAKVSK